MNKKLIYIIVILLISCRKPANIDIRLDTAIPVISCFYTSNQPFAIQIGYTYNAGENPKWEDNARIELFENDISKGILTYTDSGKYDLNFYPTAGNNYKIEIGIPNYEKIWAEDILPKPPIIADAYYTLGKSYIQIGSESGPAVDYYAFIQDTSKKNNFYQANIQLWYFSGAWQKTSFFYWKKDMINNPIMANEGDELYYSSNQSGLIFSDKLFNNQTMEFKLRSFGDTSNYNPDNHRFYFRLDAISENYYLYQKSWLIHAFNQANNVEIEGDFFEFIQLGEPSELYTNMKGGKALGIFAGYNSTEKQYNYVP